MLAQVRSSRANLFDLPWWCSPAGLALGFLLPVIFLIVIAGGGNHPGVVIRGIDFLTPRMLLVAAGMMLVLGAGGWLGANLRLRHGAPKVPDYRSWDASAALVGALALIAYCIWFKDYVFNPVLLWQSLTGEHRPGRENIVLTPGVTSLSNVSPVFFAFFTYRWVQSRDKLPLSPLLKVIAFMMVLFTLFRVYAWSERLALIEACAPSVLLLAHHVLNWSRDTRALAPKAGLRRPSRSAVVAPPVRRLPGKWMSLFVQLGPYAGIPVAILFFGGFEYFRSWETDTYRGKMDFWDFAIGRFITYYYTSLNNGAGMLTLGADYPLQLNNVMEWANKAPFGFGEAFSGGRISGFDHDQFLENFADPEFNSPSGIFSVLLDLGYPLGIVYIFLVGLLAGLGYRAYREQRLIGILTYPTFLVCFLETFRYPYLGTSRAFTIFLGVFVALLAARLFGARGIVRKRT